MESQTCVTVSKMLASVLTKVLEKRKQAEKNLNKILPKFGKWFAYV